MSPYRKKILGRTEEEWRDQRELIGGLYRELDGFASFNVPARRLYVLVDRLLAYTYEGRPEAELARLREEMAEPLAEILAAVREHEPVLYETKGTALEIELMGFLYRAWADTQINAPEEFRERVRDHAQELMRQGAFNTRMTPNEKLRAALVIGAPARPGPRYGSRVLPFPEPETPAELWVQVDRAFDAIEGRHASLSRRELAREWGLLARDIGRIGDVEVATRHVHDALGRLQLSWADVKKRWKAQGRR